MQFLNPIAQNIDMDHTSSGNEAFGMQSSPVVNKGGVVDVLSSDVYPHFIYFTKDICVIFVFSLIYCFFLIIFQEMKLLV